MIRARALDLFDVDVPDIRTPAPSVAATSSEDAADQLSQQLRASQHRSILLALAAVPADETRSRYEIHRRTGIAINVLCARIKSDLVDCGYVESVPRARPSHTKSTLLVNGYRLTAAGRERVRRAACG